MGKALGSTKTGGRKKGTPNKHTMAFGETLESRGINLLSEILDVAMKLPARERVNVYLGLLPYQFPKRKPSEGPVSLEDHLSQMNRDQMLDLRHDLTTRLGLNKTYEEMSADERTEYDRAIESVKKLIRAEEELGIGPD